jgi:hypothetical protein
VRWAALLTLAAGVVAALSVAQLAPGQASERVRVDRPAAGLPSNLYVGVNSPDEYSRQALRPTSGSWVGPAYWLPSNPAMRANATIDWEVGLDERPLSTERIALANLTKDWVEDQRAGVSLEHVVGRRVVGTIPGFFVLQVERRSSPSELVLAFPVGAKLHAFVRFLLLRPETDDFSVKGSVLASSWNRGQALLAMSRVRLEGNLPPSLVTIRVRRNRVIAGAVVDFYRHAVVGVPIVLERKTGSRWQRLRTARATAVGGFAFKVGRPGSYRVTATLDGRYSATSRGLRVKKATG